MNYKSKLTIYCVANLIGLFFWSNAAKAQLDVQISQHMFNRTYYNPSATGASAYINAFVLTRTQWANWDGAPETQLLSAHTYFPALRSGVGLNLINDQLGLERIQIAKLMYAYHAKLNDISYISLGLGAGFKHQAVEYSRQTPVDPNDPDLIWQDRSKLSPDFDLGIEYNRPRIRLGLSVTHLQQRAGKDTPLNTGRHSYAYASYSIPLGVKWDLQTSLFGQNSRRSTNLEAACVAQYLKKFWLGTSLRMDEKAAFESFVFMAGMNLFQKLRIGYAFDYNLKYLSGYSGNTHELFLHLRLPQKGPYSRSPRFFE